MRLRNPSAQLMREGLYAQEGQASANAQSVTPHQSPPSKVKAAAPPHAPETCRKMQSSSPLYSGLLGGGGKQDHMATSGHADNCKPHEHVCGHSRSVCLSSDVSVDWCSPLFRARHKEAVACGSVCSNREYFSDVFRSPSPFPSSPLPFSPLSPSFFPMSSCISSGHESMGRYVTAQSSGERFGRGRSTIRSSGPCSFIAPMCCNDCAAECLLEKKKTTCTRAPGGDNSFSHSSIYAS